MTDNLPIQYDINSSLPQFSNSLKLFLDRLSKHSDYGRIVDFDETQAELVFSGLSQESSPYCVVSLTPENQPGDIYLYVDLAQVINGHHEYCILVSKAIYNDGAWVPCDFDGDFDSQSVADSGFAIFVPSNYTQLEFNQIVQGLFSIDSEN